MTGDNYTPDSFKDRVEMQEYFEMVKYKRARDMYNATGDKKWRKEMISTPMGWNQTGGGHAFNVPRPITSMAYMGRHRNQAYNTINSPDRGFRSPYGGQDSERSLNYDAESINIYSGFSALPSWDRPFWTAFLNTPEEERDNVLNLVDRQMGSMLETAWGKGENINAPNLESYFNSYNEPMAINPVMDPTSSLSDYQAVTVENEGLSAHDFGMGWREQMQRINSDPYGIAPIEYQTAGGSIGAAIRDNLSNAEIRDSFIKILARMGYQGSQVTVSSNPAAVPETIIKLNVQRTSAATLINDYYGE